MDKLIELLNEYNNSHHNKSNLYYLFEIENGMLFCYDDVTDVQRTMQDEAMVICSKKFGFIKWLVDNDKIDLDKIDRQVRIYSYVDEYEEYDYVYPDNHRQLLMLLAIQNNPIEFLISILK